LLKYSSRNAGNVTKSSREGRESVGSRRNVLNDEQPGEGERYLENYSEFTTFNEIAQVEEREMIGIREQVPVYETNGRTNEEAARAATASSTLLTRDSFT